MLPGASAEGQQKKVCLLDLPLLPPILTFPKMAESFQSAILLNLPVLMSAAKVFSEVFIMAGFTFKSVIYFKLIWYNVN